MSATVSQDALSGQGMVSPVNTFVQPNLTLHPVAFRFLYNLFNAANVINSVTQTQANTLGQHTTQLSTQDQTIATLIGDISVMQGQIAALQAETAQIANLQAEINTINQRLAAANIP